ncbi:hypothetical protein JOD17_000132 [Geomicrobium sediminis]|uniref:ABC transporter permease n=1 Tax=Geomicrobium sediminis TaxID=1347788 RepID=A0ABS2P7Q4_9BACL|nr:hypothetical protein [Geomicrobium sediminis]
MNNNDSMSLLRKAETLVIKTPLVKLLIFIIPISMILTFVYLFSQDAFRAIIYTLNYK